MKKLIYCLLIIVPLLTSCNDEDGDAYPSGNDPVTVSKVYLDDADAKDSIYEREVTFARLGQTLRLEGTNFGGTKQILVNGYDTYFNTSLVTNNSMILQLQSKTPVSSAVDSVRNKIQFVKNSGIYTYTFTIRAASPQIKSINNTMPAAGETIVVSGENLQETNKVILPGGKEVTDITNASGDEDGKWFSFVMPEGVTGSGSIMTEGANGTAVSAKYFNNSDCMILNFDGQGSQGYWSWTETGSMINNEDLVDDPLNSGRGKVCQLVPERLLKNGIAAGKSRAAEVWTAGNGNATDDWTNWYNIIPASTPLIDVALQFDIYVPEEWTSTGYIQVNLANNSSFTGYGSNESSSIGVAYYIPWLKNNNRVSFKTEGWQIITIPLSEFGRFASEIADSKTPTFGELSEYRNGTDYRNFGMAFINSDLEIGDVTFSSSVFNQKIYVDNFRIVPCKSTIVSDF